MPVPPIGANLWIWDSPVTAGVIRQHATLVAAMGFDVIELPLEAAGDWTAAAVGPVLEATGLRPVVCAAMGPGRDLSTDDVPTVRSTQEYLSACIDAAAGITAGVVAGPLYSPTGQTGVITPDQRQRKLDALARNLAPLATQADAVGVRLAVEPLNRFETSLFNTVAQTMELVSAVDHPALGLLLDTFHMNIEERQVGHAIRLAGARLVHFHACGNDRGAPGYDGVDWPEVRTALGDVAYRGAITIESFTSANQTIATAASIWRPLAESQDALATEGLAFLRALFVADAEAFSPS